MALSLLFPSYLCIICTHPISADCQTFTQSRDRIIYVNAQCFHSNVVWCGTEFVAFLFVDYAYVRRSIVWRQSSLIAFSVRLVKFCKFDASNAWRVDWLILCVTRVCVCVLCHIVIRVITSSRLVVKFYRQFRKRWLNFPSSRPQLCLWMDETTSRKCVNSWIHDNYRSRCVVCSILVHWNDTTKWMSRRQLQSHC